jgi:hypothetical protein
MQQWKGRIRGFDWRGMIVAALFIALMCADCFLCHGWLSGVVVGGVFVLLGVTLGVKNVRMVRIGRLVPATVVDHKMEYSDDKVYYTPVVEFTDQSGRKIRKQTDAGYGIERPAVGTHVLVWYDPSGRLECQIVSAARWFVPIGLFVAGVIVLVLVAAK